MPTPFAQEFVADANYWFARGCRETSRNSGPCVDEILDRFNGNIFSTQAWCSKFVWVCADRAAQRVGVRNPLPKTASTVAMLNGAKANGLAVDTTPAFGSVFFYSRGKGLGHVGIIVGFEGADAITIEGNTGLTGGGEGVGRRRRSLADIRSGKNVFRIIHTEAIGGTAQAGAVLAGINPWVALAIAGAAGYMIYDHLST